VRVSVGECRERAKARALAARRAALPRATRISSPWTPFFFCFRVQIVEALDICAVCRAPASAPKTPYKPGKTPIYEKSANQCIFATHFVQRIFCVEPLVVQEKAFFLHFCCVLRALANTRQTTSNLCASYTEARKQRQNSVRGPEMPALRHPRD